MSCQKIPYPDREAALADIEHIKINMRYRSKKHAASQKSNRKMRAYHCLFCCKWHLTTAQKRKY